MQSVPQQLSQMCGRMTEIRIEVNESEKVKWSETWPSISDCQFIWSRLYSIFERQIFFPPLSISSLELFYTSKMSQRYCLFDSNWVYGKLSQKRQVHIKDCTTQNLQAQPTHHQSTVLPFLAFSRKEKCKTYLGQIFNQSRSDRCSHTDLRGTPSI